MIRPAALSVALLLGGCAGYGAAPPVGAAASASAQAEIGRVLDALHVAASRADTAGYFSLYTPDAVFIGTDVSERWSLPEFRAYAQPHFSKGKGWTYKPRTRSVVVGPDGRTAWFDEVLDSENYGTSRGTGVLLRTPQGWRVAQYALTFPIPNDLAKELTARIRAHEAGAAAPR
ncbi:MAG: nuclear transport factor 2 family protein [Pseudomonadota bacterium]|nr:nuclear transport factor 2 family protein [Pseudomonadota bacterium]